MFGLGERFGDLLLTDATYTLWNKDITFDLREGKGNGVPNYGTYPIYYYQLPDKRFMSVFDNNVAAQDFILHDGPGNTKEVTHIKTSGSTELYITLPGKLGAVVEENVRIWGMPVMVPEWALGWHQCRYGYPSLDAVKGVVEGYDKAGFPLDVMWGDIDYMDKYMDFTVNDDAGEPYEGLPAFVDSLHTSNRYYVPIIDAAISSSKNPAFNEGKSKNVFMKSPVSSKKTDPFTGVVWPGPAVFVDWFSDNAEDFWGAQLQTFHNTLPFDGLWNDMNEPASFCTGICDPKLKLKDPIKNRLMYTPGGSDLEDNTVSMDIEHANGYKELDVHSTYGFMMGKASTYFKKENLRTMIITRSAHHGFGKYGSLWLGDNWSTWEQMKFSVSGIF